MKFHRSLRLDPRLWSRGACVRGLVVSRQAAGRRVAAERRRSLPLACAPATLNRLMHASTAASHLSQRTLTTSSGLTTNAETTEAPAAAMLRCSRPTGFGASPESPIGAGE